MTELLIAVCMTTAGTIIGAGSFWSTLKPGYAQIMQVRSFGLIGIGTAFGFWSVLVTAGQQGLFLIILVTMLCVAVLTIITILLGHDR